MYLIAVISLALWQLLGAQESRCCLHILYFQKLGDAGKCWYRLLTDRVLCSKSQTRLFDRRDFTAHRYERSVQAALLGIVIQLCFYGRQYILNNHLRQGKSGANALTHIGNVFREIALYISQPRYVILVVFHRIHWHTVTGRQHTGIETCKCIERHSGEIEFVGANRFIENPLEQFSIDSTVGAQPRMIYVSDAASESLLTLQASLTVGGSDCGKLVIEFRDTGLRCQQRIFLQSILPILGDDGVYLVV